MDGWLDGWLDGWMRLYRSKPMGSHFGVGEVTHFGTDFGGWSESDVH